jgi:hypothetical protein
MLHVSASGGNAVCVIDIERRTLRQCALDHTIRRQTAYSVFMQSDGLATAAAVTARDVDMSSLRWRQATRMSERGVLRHVFVTCGVIADETS